ncbi:MAG: ftsK [Patescibacteria group bacterium]|nr:ftsK [Patescibacteria group bacterium]
MKRAILAILLFVISVVIILGAFGAAGIAGNFLYKSVFDYLFGFGVVLVPVMMVISGIHLLKAETVEATWVEYAGALALFLSVLGFIEIVSPGLRNGGIVGYGIGTAIAKIFDVYAGAIVLAAIALISGLVLLNEELGVPEFLKKLFSRKHAGEDSEIGSTITFTPEELEEDTEDVIIAEPKSEKKIIAPIEDEPEEEKPKPVKKRDEEDELFSESVSFSETYEYPPLSLLSKSSGKPSVGDIKANANLIKRTLLNFGIDVEMDEVSLGPTVTRYALKPAEGIKLSRIVALKSDMALALAAHPLRIEAPIPGKSLVGIEIPNKVKASVGLGTLLADPAFQNAPERLKVALGTGVAGKSYYADIGKMPHLLIAGTTGSGKSVTVHNLIMSLLYRNGPEDLRLILVDPKRVELTLYNGIPHLLTPVIKEPKKAILALKWAAKEMERRYDILEKNSCRDITSYREKMETGKIKNTNDDGTTSKMPYIVIIIDELADIMQAFPRELESGIVRLAQMSRAVGIHLILSTQRPSVNVITGLIKANIPSRLALSVASQIDSRTILDAPGAESLLGKGDMLYQGEGMSKPERMQCANIGEEELKKIVSFIKNNNVEIPDEIALEGSVDDNDRTIVSANFEDDEDDELYSDAKAIVIEAGKASTSYIQRKLKVGYSRAARLIDLLEERGIVGPADGAKPREVLGGSDKDELSTDDTPPENEI